MSIKDDLSNDKAKHDEALLVQAIKAFKKSCPLVVKAKPYDELDKVEMAACGEARGSLTQRIAQMAGHSGYMRSMLQCIYYCSNHQCGDVFRVIYDPYLRCSRID